MLHRTVRIGGTPPGITSSAVTVPPSATAAGGARDRQPLKQGDVAGSPCSADVLDFAGAQRLDLKPTGGASPAATGPALARQRAEGRFRSPSSPRVARRGHGDDGGPQLAAALRLRCALGRPDSEREIEDARKSTETTALVADVLGGATVLAAAGLTVLAYALTSGAEPVAAAKVPASRRPVRRLSE